MHILVKQKESLDVGLSHNKERKNLALCPCLNALNVLWGVMGWQRIVLIMAQLLYSTGVDGSQSFSFLS